MLEVRCGTSTKMIGAQLKSFRPMLAVNLNEKLLRFPYFAVPKLDGIRCLVLDGQARTRTMRHLPNGHAREWFAKHGELLANLDGELIAGDPTAPDCISKTVSGIMGNGGRPGFQFFVFDVVDMSGKRPFAERWEEASDRSHSWPANVGLVLQVPVEDLESLRRFEDVVLRQGYEGIMLRRPSSLYKQGRVTVAENSLLRQRRPQHRHNR